MIGLIFGETDFPKYIYRKIKDKKKYLIIDLTKKKYFKRDKYSHSVSVGQFGKIISILKENKCKEVLFAGKVQKPDLDNIKLDFKGVYYIPRIIKKSKLGDAAILKEIINILKNEKIKTISSIRFTPELSLSKGNYSKYKPNKKDKVDINNALRALNKTGQYTHVQGAISRNNLVILENQEGTRKMFNRIKKLKKVERGVLVKFPKKKQDFRIDLPTVGLNTLRQCKALGLKGVVLKHKRNIFMDKKKSIHFANKNKMFIFVK
jgi:DUF1009 family protein